MRVIQKFAIKTLTAARLFYSSHDDYKQAVSRRRLSPLKRYQFPLEIKLATRDGPDSAGFGEQDKACALIFSCCIRHLYCDMYVF